MTKSKSGPACRTFTVTLTKRAAYRLRNFCHLFNVSEPDALACMAGEQIGCLDDDQSFEMDMGRLATAFRREREQTALTESQIGKAVTP